jgi:hypothetical protein
LILQRRLVCILIEGIGSFIIIFSFFPRLVNCATAGLNEEKKLSGEALSPGFRSWFLYFLPKISPACQANSVQMRTCRSFRPQLTQGGQTLPQRRFLFRHHLSGDGFAGRNVPGDVRHSVHGWLACPVAGDDHRSGAKDHTAAPNLSRPAAPRAGDGKGLEAENALASRTAAPRQSSGAM